MTYTTTQAAVKAALFYAVQGADEIDWEVTYGDPTDRVGGREVIYIGAATTQDRAEQAPASFRRGHREEDYEITVYVDYSGSNDPLESEDTATKVSGRVEGIVLENQTLGVDGVHWIAPVGTELETGPSSEGGFRTIAKVRLGVKARLLWQ